MQKYKVDDVDVTLLAALRNDGRVSYGELADAVELSTDAIRARIARLTADGIVRIIGVVHPRSLGYEVLGTAWFSYTGDVSEFASIIAASPNVTYMVETLGTTNVLCEIAAVDDADLATIVQTIVRENPKAWLVDVWRSIDFFKWQSQGRPLGAGGSGTDSEPADSVAAAGVSTEFDVALLRLLVDNPRASYRDLANELDEPYWNVRRRTKTLFETGTIRATAMVDRLSTNNGISGAIALKITGPVEAALRSISALPEIVIVSWQTGIFNAMAEFRCESPEQLAAVTMKVAETPGVAESQVRLFIKTHVAPVPWLLENSLHE